MTAGRARPPRRSRRRQWTSKTVVVTAAVAGLALVALSLLGLSHPWTTAASQSGPARSTTPARSPSTSPPHPQVLDRSVPVRLTIASIGVNSALQSLGVKANTTSMQLPPNPAAAGWFEKGSTPGQAGPTIVVGYIAGPHGPGVFRHLAKLRVKSQIKLTRTDHITVTYRVDKIASYTTSQFPATTVYANSPRSTLRLITCGGKLHPSDPAGNAVVFAHQVAIHTPATRSSTTDRPAPEPGP